MQRKYAKIAMGILLVMVLFLPFLPSSAKAFYASTATYPYYVGTSSAKASSYNTNVIENVNKMKCLYNSWIDPAATINIIGFTWVACTVKCRRADGTEYIYRQNYWNPGVVTGNSNGAMDFLDKFCPNNLTTIWVAQAWHDFNHTGSPIWRPSTSYFSTHLN